MDRTRTCRSVRVRGDWPAGLIDHEHPGEQTGNVLASDSDVLLDDAGETNPGCQLGDLDAHPKRVDDGLGEPSLLQEQLHKTNEFLAVKTDVGSRLQLAHKPDSVHSAPLRLTVRAHRVVGPCADAGDSEAWSGRVLRPAILLVMTSESRMVFLGFGKFARADRIYALEPLRGDERGDGKRTRVWVEGLTSPIIASRTERTILHDMGDDAAARLAAAPAPTNSAPHRGWAST